jgi:ribosome-binding protein aMBF1 (putative translation factor)
MNPMESFHVQLAEEVRTHERLMGGQFDAMFNLSRLGQMLISVRTARSLSQKDLAMLLGVYESKVSRDEQNEYYGITLERAVKILDALDVRLVTHVEPDTARETVSA